MMRAYDRIVPIPRFKRPPHQRWIFLLYESPVNSHYDYSMYNSLFNLTATYRTNSDFFSIYYPNSNMIWAKNHAFNTSWDYLSGKTKMAVALISNFKTKFRLDYIGSLKKYIDVDVFGACGKPCPYSDCRAFIASKYKFLFAFENSYCEDYISEKFFETLQFDIIPVVMGSGTYDYYVSLIFFSNKIHKYLSI